MTTRTAKQASADRISARFDEWDADGDGAIERADLEAHAEAIANALGADLDSPQALAVKDAYRFVFHSFATEIGIPATGSITKEQYRHIDEKIVAQGEAAFDRVYAPIFVAVIRLCDTNADGKISRQEFGAWASVRGLTQAEGERVFSKIDKDGSGELTAGELIDTVRAHMFGTLDVELVPSTDG